MENASNMEVVRGVQNQIVLRVFNLRGGNVLNMEEFLDVMNQIVKKYQLVKLENVFLMAEAPVVVKLGVKSVQ